MFEGICLNLGHKVLKHVFHFKYIENRILTLEDVDILNILQFETTLFLRIQKLAVVVLLLTFLPELFRKSSIDVLRKGIVING